MSKAPTPGPARRGDALAVGYLAFLADVKTRIAAARTRAVLAVNSELIRLYWEIGREILLAKATRDRERAVRRVWHSDRNGWSNRGGEFARANPAFQQSRSGS